MKSTDAGWLGRLVAGVILTLCSDVALPRAHACGSGLPMEPTPSCHGPHCSAPEPAPLLPESSPRLVPSEVWGHAPRTEHDGSSCRTGWLRPTDERPTPRAAAAIFIPPR